MSTLVCINNITDPVFIRCQDDKPVVWIDCGQITAALTMTPEQRNKLRSALDRADLIETRLAAVNKALAEIASEAA